MSPVLNKLAASTSVLLLAGLALTGATGSAEAAATAGGCKGMTAVNNTAVGNRAPVLANDTANVVAGDSHVVRVLANDSDPDGNRLFVVSLSTPLRGKACVEANGDIEYVSEISTTNYVQRLTYGVTDGDFYRTATLTVTVEGVKPVAAQVTQRLKKHGKKPGQRAHITFTNPNKRALIIAAGSPKKRKPALFRTLAPGQSVVLVTKQRRIIFVSARRDPDGIPLLVGFGSVRTKTGKVVLHADENDDDEYRTAPHTGTQARQWIN
jgi:hypothetical protein